MLWMNKIKEDDIKAFEHVFRTNYVSLTLFAYTITGRKDIAEEAVQDVFYILWKDRQAIQIRQSLKAYLYTAVRHQALRHCERTMITEKYNRHIAEPGNTPTQCMPDENLEYKELEETIGRALTNLPERRRRIFEMHRDEGLKYKEIARELSLSVKTIEAEMTKTYQAIRVEMEKYYQL